MRAVKPYIVSKSYRFKRNQTIRIAAIFIVCALVGIVFLVYKKPYTWFAKKTGSIRLTQTVPQESHKQEPGKGLSHESPKPAPEKTIYTATPASPESPTKIKIPKPELKMHADDYFKQGHAYHKKGEHDRTIEDSNKAIGLKSDYDAYAYYNRGVAIVGKAGMTGRFLISKRLVIWGMRMGARICRFCKRDSHVSIFGINGWKGF